MTLRKEQNIPNYTKTPSTSFSLFINPPKHKRDRDKSKIKQRICILIHKHIWASDLPFRFTSAARDTVVTRLREPPIERDVGIFFGRWEPPMERSLFPFLAEIHRSSRRRRREDRITIQIAFAFRFTSRESNRLRK